MPVLRFLGGGVAAGAEGRWEAGWESSSLEVLLLPEEAAWESCEPGGTGCLQDWAVGGRVGRLLKEDRC